MSTQDHARQFSQIPFLSNLEPRAIELIAFSGETRIMRRGEILFQRGDPADAGFVVLSGRISLDPGDGRDAVSILPGALVGEMALLIETHRKATATVAESSGVLRIPRTLFHRVLRENPASAVRLRAFCATRLTAFARELAAVGGAMATKDMPEADLVAGSDLAEGEAQADPTPAAEKLTEQP